MSFVSRFTKFKASHSSKSCRARSYRYSRRWFLLSRWTQPLRNAELLGLIGECIPARHFCEGRAWIEGGLITKKRSESTQSPLTCFMQDTLRYLTSQLMANQCTVSSAGCFYPNMCGVPNMDSARSCMAIWASTD